MALVKILKHATRTGQSMECQVLRIASDGTVTQLDHADGIFRALPATPKVPLVEVGTTGLFTRAESRSAWADGNYVLIANVVGMASPDGGVEFEMKDDVEVRLDVLAHVGGLTGAHTATIQFYRTATVTPIPDVLCDVYDSTEATRLNGTQIKSDVNGQISFSRDNGTYKIRAMLAGFTFTTGTVTVAAGNASLTMYGAAITIPNPPVAGTQTLYGNVRELNWGVATGDTVTAVIADKGQVVNGALIQHLNLSTTVDANSQFSLTVPKGAVIRLTVKDHATHTITINQENTYDVATYLTE